MPPLPRLRTPALDGLAQGLRFAPPDALSRDVERAEALAAELEPEREYPVEWIVFRVTGYRPDSSAPQTVRGGALLADLSALVERLSEPLRLSAAALGDRAISADDLARRWNVSRKTLDRYRRRGLPARRVRTAAGKPALVFMRAVVDRFEAAHGAEIAGAATYSRMSGADADRVLRRARRYRRAGLSLNEAAKRIAGRLGRSHEAIRQALRRHDARSGSPIFGAPLPPSARRRLVAWRAARRGLEPALLAERQGRSRSSVVRLINDHRAELLRSLDLRPHVGPGFDGGGAEATYLSPGPARSGLGAPGETDLLALIEPARAAPPPPAAVELARAMAYHYLVYAAARVISVLPARGASPLEVDRAETMLRWAARLKAELVRLQLGLMVKSIEAQAGAPLDHLRAVETRELVTLGLGALSQAVDVFDPFRGGRLAAPSGLAVNRAASRWAREWRAAADPARPPRATPRMRAGVTIEDWTRSLAAWQAWLEPDARVRPALGRVEERDRALLVRRMGWDGGPPATLARIAKEDGLTLMRAARRERAAIRAALGASRRA